MADPDPVKDPILHKPWDIPTSHYQMNPTKLDTEPPLYVKERRPSQPSLADIGRNKDSDNAVTQYDEPYATINEIRGYVADWREGGFKGSKAQKLLARWEDEGQDPHGDTRAYFCQREAVETIMWLMREYKDEPLRKVEGRMREINARWNDGINRMAIKMATGAGKTRAMTMLIGCLEKMHPEGCHVVIINPNLTVQDRLQTIREDVRRSDIVPHRDNSLNRAKIDILNFHKFRPKDDTFSGLGGSPSTFERKVLGTVPRIESSRTMLDRLLDQNFSSLPLYVFQDEGHHCRRRTEQIRTGNLKTDELDDEGQWFSALLAIKASRNLKAVIDFSATPAYLSIPPNLASAVFPWVVSDFGIDDAIESGICKIPRLPAKDSQAKEENGISNLYRFCVDEKKQKTKWGIEPPFEVKNLMQALAQDWRENRYEDYSAVGRVPAVIAVVNSVHNAIVLYNWVTGSKNDDGSWKPGAIEEFSNIDPDTKRPLAIAELPTIMAHSRITDGGEDLNSEAKKVIKGQRELRAPDSTEKEASELIRTIFSTVGVPGEPGERIRCVISVSMLSEGWDAKTVTHVFGFRRFNSVLLIEQVVGRALRRISLDEPEREEYAEVFGVPYPGLRRRGGTGKTTCGDPVPKTVQSLDEKSQYQIAWPNVKNLELTIPEGNRFRLIPEKVSEFKPDLPEQLLIKLRDPSGHGEELEISTPSGRRGKVIFKLASKLCDLWLQSMQSDAEKSMSSLNRRGLLFVDAKRAIEAWLTHEKVRVQRVDVLADNGLLPNVVEEVAKSCVSEEGADSGLRVVFEDGPKSSNTDGVHFQTTLREFVADLGKSHLNAAACHSSWESDVARKLDDHEAIRSWVRNFRLDWRIPWWDTRMATWREYEPDFVAVLEDDEPHHLVIEVKGLEDDASELKKQAAEKWCEVISESSDPATKGKWSYVYVTQPDQFDNQISQLIGA